MKKLSNPFKIWESWVAMAIAYFLVYQLNNPLECCFRKCALGFIPVSCISNISWLIITLIAGFLIGWGVHNLLKKFLKNEK